jgi:hypothetical protein
MLWSTATILKKDGRDQYQYHTRKIWGGAETATKLCARRITASARRNHSGSGTKAISAVVARNSPSELVVEFSLGDSTSRCVFGSRRFCSELCVSCPSGFATQLDNHMPSCSHLLSPSPLRCNARQACKCMMPPKGSRRLPGHLDCTAEMFHGSGRKAAREGRERQQSRTGAQLVVSDWRGESEQIYVGIRSFSAFV